MSGELSAVSGRHALGLLRGGSSRLPLTAYRLLFLSALACQPASVPLHLETRERDGVIHLSLQASSRTRINARLKPAFELTNGAVLRFDSPQMTADSSYYLSPPRAEYRGKPAALHGTLRASICDDGASVCRTVELEL